MVGNYVFHSATVVNTVMRTSRRQSRASRYFASDSKALDVPIRRDCRLI
jgi:hypothetical protein